MGEVVSWVYSLSCYVGSRSCVLKGYIRLYIHCLWSPILARNFGSSIWMPKEKRRYHKLSRLWYNSSWIESYNTLKVIVNRAHTEPGKPRKMVIFKKSHGKPGILTEIYVEFIQVRESPGKNCLVHISFSSTVFAKWLFHLLLVNVDFNTLHGAIAIICRLTVY